jgi:uncharacterized protein YktB (UPF0637 family)
MSFAGFVQADFDTFSIDGLDARMEAIRGRIQPKFKVIGEKLCDNVAMLAGNEMFLHIAKHARRKVNPPVDTWMALCHNKRGYKQHPHFQIGLFDDRVFIWLALIYELPNKKAIAGNFLEQIGEISEMIPAEFVLSFDHMKKDAVSAGSLTEEALEEALIRFRDVKKAELLVGRHIMAGQPVLKDGEAFVQLAKDTFTTLMPLYRMAFV